MGDSIEMQLICKNLQSSERSIRQSALKDLLRIFEKNESDECVDRDEWFNATYLFIIKCYSDRFEMCRSLAASIVSEFLLNSPNINDSHLDYVVTILRRRLGQGTIVEESEELRLQLAEQTLQVIQVFSANRNETDPLMRHYNDIIEIVLKTLTDPYTCVQRKICEVIIALSQATRSFHVRAESLVDPLIDLLCHRQSATRVMAIDTLGYVCMHIDNKNDRIVKIITSISPLLMDAVPAVRRQCGRVGCRLLLDLRDRYSFFERLLPLALCCLQDETEEIREEIRLQFIECGRLYYQENEKELQKLDLVDDKLPCPNYLEKVSGIRPPLGCRALVQRSLRVVQIVAAEMQDWKPEVRQHALKLLWQIVYHAEGAFTVKFVDALTMLAKCCQDDERIVVDEAKHVATLMGRLLIYDDWIEHALNALQKYKPSLGLLRCFCCLLDGVDNDKKSKTTDRIAQIFADASISHSLDKRYHSTILDTVEQLVDLHLSNPTDECREEERKFLFEILVKVCSLANAHDAMQIGERGKELLNKLCRSPANRSKFQGKYVAAIVESIDDLDCEHSERSERILLLYGCIKLCGFQIEYLDTVKRAIELVLEHSNANAKIKILTATSMAMLNWTKTMKISTMEANTQSLQQFVDDIIAPQLVWRAGRTAESIRVVALQVLCSMGETADCESRTIYRTLIPQLASLADNDCALTRGYAMRCILKCDQLPYEDYKQLVSVIVNALDDPCPDIRGLALQSIGQVEVDHECEAYNSDSHHTHIEYILSRLILQLDDSYLKHRPLLLESLERLAKRHPKTFHKKIDELPATFPYHEEIKPILDNLN